MWAIRPHTLKTLYEITPKKVNFILADVENVFNIIIWIVAHDNLISYTDFDKHFDTYTETINLELGTVISK